MTDIDWIETDDGYTGSGYRISRVGSGQWSVGTDGSSSSSCRPHLGDDPRTFSSLKSARAAALHLEITGVRRIKLIRHLTVSILMGGLSVAFYLMMSAATAATRLEWFVVSGVALVVALSEGLDAFVLLVQNGWDHEHDVPRITIVDKVLSMAVVSTLLPKHPPVTTGEHTVHVRPLT